MSILELKKHTSNFNFLNWTLLILCALIWGCSYFLIKHALKGFDPIQVADLRILSGGFVLLPFILLAFKKIPFKDYKYVFICSVAGNGVPIYFYPLAQTHISSSVIGIINSLTPLATYFIGILFYGLPNKKLKFIGVMLGFLGALCLVLFKSQVELKAEILFLFIALSVPFMYGLSSNVLKKHLTGLPSLGLTSLMYFMLFVPSIPLLFYLKIPEKIQESALAKEALPYALTLGVMGTAVAMSLFNILIKRTDIMFAASVSYLMPIVAIFLGLVDGETIGLPEFLGLGLILSGVLLINRTVESNKIAS